ncbi:MAG: hypothetical protein WD845_01105 [Pirellulales bacterium]
MRTASGLSTDSSHATHSSAGSVSTNGGIALDSLPGFDAQSLVVTLIGVAGSMFVFAAWNALSRAATVKVRKH